MTNPAQNVSRRKFITYGSCFGAYFSLARRIPLTGLPSSLVTDSRVSQTPIADKGFASVRKVGEGLYATISDPSKGYTTISNGGFLVGKDGAVLIEGFASAPGASFQMDSLRMVSRVPVMAALDTHYHYDHSCGNAFYGTQGIPIWAHVNAAHRIAEDYSPMQSTDEATAMAPYQKRIAEAKSDTQRQHAQGDLAARTGLYKAVAASVLSLPNHPIDPAKLPMTIDLGGLSAILEAYPGHSGTDMIVRIPQQNVVYTGDLLFNGWYPVTIDSQVTVSGWRNTLKKFAAFDKDTLFIPGHGQICGQEGIASTREIFDDIAAQAEKMYKAGVPAQEAIERYAVPDKFNNFLVYSWDFTVGTTITKLYEEWRPI